LQVQKALGKGSYGTVYRAKRYSDGKVYALKEADVGSMSAIERKDAVNEIRLMASIRNENIVKYHEAILDGDPLPPPPHPHPPYVPLSLVLVALSTLRP